MNQIKIIKKNAQNRASQPPQRAETASESNFKQREITRIVENWVADWRRRKESEARRAFVFYKGIK